MNIFTNVYECTIKEIDGVIRFFVTFTDINCMTHEIEVDESVYEAFQGFTKIEKRQQNHFDRHIEHMSLTDEELEKRSYYREETVDEIVIDKICQETLHKAIQELPSIQRRRLILYYEYGLSLMKIAKIENCSDMAVKYSIDNAKQKISQLLKKYFE